LSSKSRHLSPAWKLFRASERSNIPLSMILELTRRCHLRCVHCYLEGSREPDSPELSTREWKNVLLQLKDSGCMYLAFTGGEVLLRPDIMDLARFARRLAFNLRIFTTAHGLTPVQARGMAALGVDRVDVSLYGRPKTHAAVTGSTSAFEGSLRGINHLRRAGVRVVLKAPLMSLNVEDRAWLLDFARKRGLLCSFDPTLAPRNNGALDNLDLRLPPAKLDEVFSDPRLTTPEEIEGGRAFQSGDYEDFLCSAGRNTGAIGPSGDVFPCLQWPVSCGNVRFHDFGEIWKGSMTLAGIRKLKDLPARDADPGSDGIPIYRNNCPGIASIESGDPLKPVPYDRQVQDSEWKAKERIPR